LSLLIVTHGGETSRGDQATIDLTACANRLGLDGRLPHYPLEHSFLVNGNGAHIPFRLPTGYLAGPAVKGFPQLVEKTPLSVPPAMYIGSLATYSAQGDERTAAVTATLPTSREEQNFDAKAEASSVGSIRDAISGCFLQLIESHGPKKLLLVDKSSII
jgi:hypothetical protein